MKKAFKLLGIAVLFVLRFSVVSCSNSSTDTVTVPGELQGIWKDATAPATITFTTNSFTVSADDGSGSFTIEDLVFVTVTNDGANYSNPSLYPSGYTISGKHTTCSGVYAPRVGQNFSDNFFLNNLKTAFSLSSGEIYTKQ